MARLVAQMQVPAKPKFSPRGPRTPRIMLMRPRINPTAERIGLNGYHQNTMALKNPMPMEAPASPPAIGATIGFVAAPVGVPGWGCSKGQPSARDRDGVPDAVCPEGEPVRPNR